VDDCSDKPLTSEELAKINEAAFSFGHLNFNEDFTSKSIESFDEGIDLKSALEQI